MNNSISWHPVSSGHLVAHVAGRQVDLRYSLSGPQSGWNIFIDGVRSARDDDLRNSKIMASALLQPFLRPESWLTDVELGI